MKKLALAVAATTLMASVGSIRPANGQEIYPHMPKILLHLMAPTAKNACTTYPQNSLAGSCLNAVTSGVSDPFGQASYFVYVVVAKGDSVANIAGLQLGIDYDREYVHNASSDSDGQGIDMFGCSSAPLSSSRDPTGRQRAPSRYRET